jgi:uncharacterized protein
VTNEWPVDGLDVDLLVAGGWRARPFEQFILKLHSRCNLACDYCYMYQLGDTTWRSQPSVMSSPVIKQASLRISEHVTRHQLATVEVGLHGGEPLLAGKAAIAEVATEVRRRLPSTTLARFAVQTNGVLLTEPLLDTLFELDVRVCVSIDGTQETHDRHRRYRGGRSSYAQVRQGIQRLARDRYRSLFAGLVSVIDLEEDPLATYEALLEFGPPRVDFLLPHANWTTLPPRPAGEAAPYGRWLATVFDRWYDAPAQETEVRLFVEIINLILGGDSRTESVGLSPVTLITVNTDGSLEQVDTLRSAYPGAAATGLSVLTHTFDDVLRHPSVVARQLGMAALADTCQSCELRRVCGGGHYAHRYRQGAGFRNPSVYCPDLTVLINHIAARVRAGLSTLPDHVSGGSMSQSAR